MARGVRSRVVVLLALALGAAGVVPAVTMTPAEADAVIVVQPSPVATSPQAVTDLVYQVVEPASRTPYTSNGSVAACQPGALAASDYDTYLHSINAYRTIAGLPDVTLDPAKSSLAQAAALIMAANPSNGLTHGPSPSLRCWSQQGYDGASHSNLSQADPDLAGRGYMDDFGDNNHAAGHRSWILSPYAETFGFGAIAGYTALHVANLPETSDVASRDWIAWPSPGNFPAFLAPEVEVDTQRWSLTAPDNPRSNDDDTDFGSAQVQVIAPGGTSLPITSTTVTSYGNQAGIVWDLKGIPRPAELTGPATYAVTVSGAARAGAPLPPITYSVTLLPLLAVQNLSAPVITGELKTGSTVSATGGTWTGPAGETTKEWLVDGQVMGQGKNYTIGKADVGKTVAVRVTKASLNYTAGSVTVTAAGVVSRGAFAATSVPRLRWDARHPRYLNVSGPKLTIDTKRFSYLWTLNGKKIAKTTRHTLLVKGRYGPGKLRVQVTAKAKGYGTVKVWSEPFKLRRA